MILSAKRTRGGRVPKQILIIDDEELITHSLRRLLESQGFTVRVASRGEDALTMIREEPCDLIVADLRMPGLNGVETIGKINELCGQRNVPPIPVLFITGFADPDLEQQIKSLEATCIHKPFDLDVFVSEIKRLLSLPT
ncbi:MAG: response regulator [Candidatus Omnitrophica bacterium]|nr:response regulator [Candidatus Omnitrophota bacterium]